MLLKPEKADLLALLVGLFLGCILVELCAQAFYFVVVKKKFDSVKGSDYFYLQKSLNQGLGYELKPTVNTARGTKVLKINRFGMRDTSDTTQKRKYRVGLLGDSVVFGTNQGQDSTLSELVEGIRHDSIQVCNLGVPGYSTAQMVVQFEKYEALYHFDEVVYLLNLNDFTTRNSIYEGADNGVYRYFNPPTFKSLWLWRKLIYRIQKKGEVSFNTEYYHWAFNGTKKDVFSDLIKLKERIGKKFTVVILPSGTAYKNGQYELAEMVDEIEQLLASHHIQYCSPTNEFKLNTSTLLDETDHLTIRGNILMAKEISMLLLK